MRTRLDSDLSFDSWNCRRVSLSSLVKLKATLITSWKKYLPKLDVFSPKIKASSSVFVENILLTKQVLCPCCLAASKSGEKCTKFSTTHSFLHQQQQPTESIDLSNQKWTLKRRSLVFHGTYVPQLEATNLHWNYTTRFGFWTPFNLCRFFFYFRTICT